jgi:hypothetical protein
MNQNLWARTLGSVLSFQLMSVNDWMRVSAILYRIETELYDQAWYTGVKKFHSVCSIL